MIKRLTPTILAALAWLATGAAVAAAQDPMSAPAPAVSADGRTVSAAGRTLVASQVHGLAATGQSVRVTGSGYDVGKGVYVSLCVVPATNHAPTPCGGGVDRTGASDASVWVSSNPPDYAAGLTTPYGDGGSFDVTLSVSPRINDQFDCFAVRCALVTRNDHTRSTDRSQDLFLPVTFSTGSGPVATPPVAAPPTTGAPPPGATTTTTAAAPVVTSSARPAPTAQLSDDGRRVSDAVRSFEVSDVDRLDAAGVVVTARGTGFDPERGIYVALCVVPAAGAAPGPCATGGDAAAWVSSSPPDYGRELAVPFAEGGGFELDLRIRPVIDDTHDCREVPCAITTRSDDTAAADRGNDLLVPVTFADALPSGAADQVAERDPEGPSRRDSGGAGGIAVAAAGGAGALVLAAVGVRQLRRRPGHDEVAA